MSKTARRLARTIDAEEATKKAKEVRDRVFDTRTVEQIEDDEFDDLPFKEDIVHMMKKWK